MEQPYRPAGYAPDSIDITQPSAARAYDYLLGGCNNFAADRELARQALTTMPDIMLQVQANRAFLRRAVRFLVQAGVRQFLDLGSGIPTAGNVHEVAQQAAPDSRVVYVDIDPVAVTHSRYLLTGNDQVTVIQEDLRRPDAILNHPEVRALLDFDRPVALLLVAVLQAITDSDDPAGVLARLRGALAPGSYLAIAHATHENRTDETRQLTRLSRQASTVMTLRPRAQITSFFAGFDLVEPGLVWAPQWRPDFQSGADESAEHSVNLVGVGHKCPGPGPGHAIDSCH